MKKVLGIGVACLCLAACGNYHGKQPIDDTYYKQSQSVAWPTEQKASVSQKKATTTVKKAAATKATTAGKASVSGGVGSAEAAQPEVKWQDASAPAAKVAVPKAVEKKIQCVKTGDTYTCRYGRQICGLGCQSDGSNCSYGYCLKSECDDVMGQKWNWVMVQSDKGWMYGCKHPNYSIYCYPHGSNGIKCTYDDRWYNECGSDCNKNGTDCGKLPNNCWDKYR